MDNTSNFFSFVRENGRNLNEINPGSNEYALIVKDAYWAIELLKGSAVAIVGGDIITEDSSGKVVYAYQLWGREFHYLNWYCSRMVGESDLEFASRSYEIAKVKINRANEVSKELKRECFVVLVIIDQKIHLG